MNNEYKVILTKYEKGYVCLYIHDDKAVEIQLFKSESPYEVGDIYSAEIKDKVEGLDASFVSISKDKKGYLNGTDYKNGSLVTVMIKKKESSNKQDVVTDKLVIPGIYNEFLAIKQLREQMQNL